MTFQTYLKTSQNPSDFDCNTQISLDSVNGICFPLDLNSITNILLPRSIIARRDRATQILNTAFSSERVTGDTTTARFIETINDLSSIETFQIFDDAWSACLFAKKIYNPIEDVSFCPTTIDYLHWAFVATMTYSKFIDEAAIICRADNKSMSNYIYIPKRHVLFNIGTLPIAGILHQNSMQFITGEGKKLSINRSNLYVPSGSYLGGAIKSLDYETGVPILNEIPLFQHLAVSPVATGKELKRAQAIFTEGMQLLRSVWPSAHTWAEQSLRGVLLLEYKGISRSHTSALAPQVLMCTAESPVKVAEALCHELTHARMHLILELEPILEDDGQHIHISPWRRDRRPLIGIVHGVHAFLNLCLLYEKLAHFYGSKFEKDSTPYLTTQKAKVRQGWSYLSKHAKWTVLGIKVAAALEDGIKTVCI